MMRTAALRSPPMAQKLLRANALLPPVVFALLSSLAGFALNGCARRETAVDAGIRTQTLQLNNAGDARDFDPQTTTLPADFNVIRALMEGLVEIDPADCHAVPGVAERWETSPDGLTWTFHLRAGARWSNGDPVTAHDFAYACRRILSPALGAEFREQFFCLKNAEEFTAGKLADFARVGARAADARTFVLTLKQPVPYLPTLAAQCPWYPVHRDTIERYGRMDQRATAWTKPGHFVGNGAFLLQEWKPNQVVRVVKSPTYWDRDRVRLREVVFHPIENVAVGETAFRAGQLHVTGLPVDKVASYRGDPRTAPLLHESPSLETAFLRLNCRRAPLSDVRVRRALSLALDRGQLARRVVHCEQPAFALTPPGCAGYTAARALATDGAEARRLLAAAGFPEGRGFPRLEVMFYLFFGSEQPVAEAIQQMWHRQLGVDVALVKQELKVTQAARRSGAFQIIISGWTGDYLDPTTFLDLGHSANANNCSGWASAAYDRFLAEAAGTPDQAKRYGILRRAEALLLAELPFIPLFHEPFRHLRHPAVRGWRDNLLDLHPLKHVYLEK